MSPFFRGGQIRIVGVALIVAIFLTGGMAGAAVDRVLTGETAKRDAPHEQQRGHIIDRVPMTEEQRADIDAILERRSERMQATWAEISPRLNAITDSARLEILEVLTPEQRADYEQRLEARAAERQRKQEEDE